MHLFLQWSPSALEEACFGSRIRPVGLYDILSMQLRRDVLTYSEPFQNMSGYPIRIGRVPGKRRRRCCTAKT